MQTALSTEKGLNAANAQTTLQTEAECLASSQALKLKLPPLSVFGARQARLLLALQFINDTVAIGPVVLISLGVHKLVEVLL